MGAPPNRAELTGWKQIADYLGVSVRTAVNWKDQRSLPVRRMRGDKPRVFALPAELDAWRAAQTELHTAEPIALEEESEQQNRQNGKATTKRAALIAPVVIGLCLLTLATYFRTARRQPSVFHMDGRLLSVFDGSSNLLWRHYFPAPCPDCSNDPASWYQRKALARFVDLDDDGEKEMLVAYQSSDDPRNLYSLYCFDEDGKLRWPRQYRLGREVKAVDGTTYPAHYAISLMAVLRRPAKNGGVIVVGGYRGGTSLYLVELLDKNGRRVGEYFHHGWFFTIATSDLDKDGDEEVILGGVNNSFGSRSSDRYGAALVVLDPDRMHGQGSVSKGDPRGLIGLPTGAERASLLFREFAEHPDPRAFCRVEEILSVKDFLEIRLTQGTIDRPTLDMRFNQRLEPAGVAPSGLLQDAIRRRFVRPISAAEFSERMRKEVMDVMVLRNDFAMSR